MQIDWKGWLGWAAATMVGVEMVLLVSYWEIFNPGNDGGIEVTVMIGLVGMVFGTMQWIWLRWRMSKAGLWIPATVVGWYLTAGLFILGNWHPVDSIVERFGRVGETVRACLFPVALSLPQWFLLQRQFRKAGYWIPTRLIAWLAGIGRCRAGKR